jgi:hypothetical protein
MPHKTPILMVTLTMFCAGGANAQDLCFQYTNSGGGVFVAKGQTLPAANGCKPFNAVEKMVPGDIGSVIGGLTGTLCADRFASRYVFHYSSHSCGYSFAKQGTSYFESGFCMFKGRPSPTGVIGSCRGTVVTAHPTKPIEGAGFLLDAKLSICNESLNEFPCPPP